MRSRRRERVGVERSEARVIERHRHEEPTPAAVGVDTLAPVLG